MMLRIRNGNIAAVRWISWAVGKPLMIFEDLQQATNDDLKRFASERFVRPETSPVNAPSFSP
jgi:hypothetical protein